MTWLLPAFLATGALASLPVLLHLLRRKPKQFIQFPSLRFLGPRILRESRKHRIRRWIVLAMRCLLILLIAAAFARPFFPKNSDPTGMVTVFVVDNSMSMQTSGRWESLQSWSNSFSAKLRPGDQAGVMLMAPSPAWLVPVTDDISAVKTALANFKPGFTAARYNPALQLAGATLAGLPANVRHLVWISDHQHTGWREVDFNQPLPPGVTLHFPQPPAAPSRQAAILNTHIAESSEGYILNLEIQQFLPAQDTRTLSIHANGTLLAQHNIELTSSETASLRIDIPAPPGTALQIRAELDPDDLPADDIAFGVFDAQSGPAVLTLPTPGQTDFLSHAIASSQQASTQSFRTVSNTTDDWSVAVVNGTGQLDDPDHRAKINAHLQAGGSVWVMVDGSKIQAEWLSEHGISVRAVRKADALSVRDWDLDHPLLSAFAGESLLPLLRIEFRSGWALEGDALLPLARWADQSTAVAELSTGRGRMLLTGFPATRESSTLPLTGGAFVPFVHQALTWLHGAGAAPQTVLAGEPLELPGERGTWKAILSNGEIPPREVERVIVPETPGIFEFLSGTTRRIYAVNPPPQESDPAQWPNADWLTLQSAEPAPKPTRLASMNILNEQTEQRGTLWWWLIAVTILLMLAEVSLANRTAP